MPNRTMCEVLKELRKSVENLNIFTIYRFKNFVPFLIEEIQTMGNRMESSLWDQKDYTHLKKKIKEARKELKELQEKIEKAEEVLKDGDKD